MSKRVRHRLIFVLGTADTALFWAGLTVHQRLPGLLLLGLAAVVWVPMALLVPASEVPGE